MIGYEWVKTLKKLKKIHYNDYWANRILSKIYELETEKNSENSITSIDIKQAKKFLFNKTYLSDRDFWIDITEKLQSIKDDIENG